MRQTKLASFLVNFLMYVYLSSSILFDVRRFVVAGVFIQLFLRYSILCSAYVFIVIDALEICLMMIMTAMYTD